MYPEFHKEMKESIRQYEKMAEEKASLEKLLEHIKENKRVYFEGDNWDYTQSFKVHISASAQFKQALAEEIEKEIERVSQKMLEI